MKTSYRKKDGLLPLIKFFCGDGLDTFTFKETEYKGRHYRNAKCVCKKGQNGDPFWKTSCAWEHKDAPFSSTDAYAATCETNQPDNTQLDYDNGVLDLENDQDSADQNS